MIFQDNVIKKYLENVYFITGTACGGKTTISRELARRYNLMFYDIDERFDEHKLISDKEYQPNMNIIFKNADEYFGRSIDEYKKWLIDNTREQLDFVLLDLIRLSQDRIVLCDCHLTVEQADVISDPSRVVFLIKNSEHLIDDYCNRKDHEGFKKYIYSATDAEKAKYNCNETLKSINTEKIAQIKASKYFWLERDENSTVDGTVQKVEKHFGYFKNLYL